MASKVIEDKCDGCGACVEACPAEAITVKNDKAVIDSGICVGCEVCIDECPVGAIETD